MRMPKSAFWVVAFLSLSACGPSVQRLNTNAVVDLNGRWDSTDARLTAEKMISDCLSRPWLSNFQQKDNREPVVIVGDIYNKSFEHINTDIFIQDIESELINSGKVKFVADDKQRAQLRQERLDQDVNASAATRKAMGKELGADYMLEGTLDAIKTQEGGREVMYYQVNLQLINIETNNIAWIGQKKIKKYISRPGWTL
jgi:uncharacterized protein (TIGR02722 family)